MEYDGTHYYGFQRQVATQPTIQSELERAISQVSARTVEITGAGRTDRGVHASGQVISFELAWRHDAESLKRAINATLPNDIVVLKVEATDSDFHPRYDAQRRAYRYYLYNSPERSPLYRLYSWYVRTPLNMDVMNEAASYLVGVHDFATFGQPPQGDVTVRELFRAAWQREGRLLSFYIEGNAFLYRMVRSIVGSLKVVGEGKWTVDEFVAALKARDRGRAAMTAPPEGLCLVSITYDR